MSDTARNEDDSTNQYLKTNGPPPSAFTPDVPAYVLDGMTKKERWLHEMVSIGNKQNGWLIEEVKGLKGAHRVIHRRLDEGQKRFEEIDKTLDVFIKLHDRYLSRRATIRNVFIGLATLLILPFLATLTVEWIKHIAGWK